MAARWRRVPFAWLALLLLTCSWGNAQDKRSESISRLNKLIDDRFAATRCPGLSVTVAANNEIVFSSALGMADVEQGVPLKTTSVHRLASLSKPITGTIIMDLVSRGRLSLDAPVRRYLPGLPEAYTDVTLRHLLDHQSGVGGAEGGDVAFSSVFQV
jgi:D-alanyl-D-alanine carboxypeptidase